MKLHIIVIAYERPVPMRILIDCFLSQYTKYEWDMIIIHDGPASQAVKDVMKLYRDDKRILFIDTDVRVGNWGHENRREMLQLQEGAPDDFVLITNDDNYYVPKFVQMFMDEAVKPRTGMVYCDFLHHNFVYDVLVSRPKVNYMDMGAFIVNLPLAKEVGFVHNVPHSDGLYAEECAAKCIQKGLKVTKIPKPLFVHN